jgi:predicted GNAT family acetyltransferase
MSIDPKSIRLERVPDGGRYVYGFPDGSEAEMEYIETRNGVVTITHTETPVAHRGRGVAAALVTKAVADFRAAGLKVAPVCSFAVALFRRHRDWSDLLFKP